MSTKVKLSPEEELHMKNDLKEDIINLVGLQKVTFNIEDRFCYSRDITPICLKWIRQYDIPPYVCDCVAFPETKEDIIKLLAFANQGGIAVTIYGGGSGSVGGVIPLNGGITIDMGKFNEIKELDEQSCLITVGSGILGDELEMYLNARGYTLRHYPQSLRSASIGGMIATKSTGQFSTKYGSIENIVRSLEVILANGEVLRTINVPRSSTGPNLHNFFIGSEGIYGVITEATLKIFPIPESMIFQCYIAKNLHNGINSIKKIMQSGIRPAVVRFYNQTESYLKFKSLGLDLRGWLLIYLFEGRKRIAKMESEECLNINKELGLQYIGHKLGTLWYEHRYDTKKIMELNRMEGGISDAIEISAKWSSIERVYAEINDYFISNNIQMASHISHAYHDGASIYNIFYAQGKSEREAEDIFFKLWKEVLKIAMENGASISHHHGIGMIKSEELKEELRYGYEIIKALKRIVDPNGILNPGKLIKQ